MPEDADRGPTGPTRLVVAVAGSHARRHTERVCRALDDRTNVTFAPVRLKQGSEGEVASGDRLLEVQHDGVQVGQRGEERTAHPGAIRTGEGHEEGGCRIDVAHGDKANERVQSAWHPAMQAGHVPARGRGWAR